MKMKNKLMRMFLPHCLALATTFFVAGCDAGAVSNWFGTKPPYPVKGSTLAFGGRIGVSPIYWVDNDRMLFPGYAVDKRKNADGTEALHGTPPGVYIWDTKNNTYARHADLNDPMWFLCFNKGFIAYSVGNTGRDEYGTKYIVKAGMLGQEKQLRTDIQWAKNPELEQCHEPEVEVRPEHRNAGVLRLRPEHGYIVTRLSPDQVANARIQNTPVEFYRPGQTKPIVLPILPKETFHVEPYSESAQKYLIIPSAPKSWDINGRGGPWPAGTTKPIYLLSPEGHIETIQVPSGPWQGMNNAYLTVKGIFIVSNNAVGANSKNAGGYLLHDGKVTKLFDHLVDGAGVSPDGYKIAYANNDFNPKTTEYVQVIDLCQ